MKERSRILNGAIDMSLSGEIDDVIYFLDQALDQRGRGNITADESVTAIGVKHAQILKVSGIGQLIHINQSGDIPTFHHELNEMRPNKSGPTGDQQFHDALNQS